MKVIIEQIKTPINVSEDQIFDIAKARLKKTRAFSNFGDLYIYKRSIDARNKDDIKLVFSVCAEVNATKKTHIEKLSSLGIKIKTDNEIEFVLKGEKPSKRPLIVGFGPGGMFCALALAKAGLSPVVIERGADVDTRVKAVESFYLNKVLDIDTNIQFGAGGAGTFSDGKLNTLINDPKCDFVLKAFADFGAPKEICYNAKPHIGTDVLRNVVKNIANEIISLGGEIHYNTKLLSYDNGSAHTTRGDFEYSSLVLAIGHSARDTYAYLMSKGVAIEAKPFSVGVRVEHLQSDINEAMYGKYSNSFEPASYKIFHRENDRGVYSFCMCPGGEVVAAQSEENTVVVNGMSNYKRDGKNANSAIVVQVNREDYGNTPIKAIEFQRSLEKNAFNLAGGEYKAPVQTMKDFYLEKAHIEPKRIMPSYMNGNVQVTDLNKILPKFVCDYLKLGFSKFGQKINGYNADDVVLTGVETRTSSPVRILRTEKYTMLNDNSVYPCAEGAGYAGGIMSAAVDGINVALAILEK
ncbi:MAG: hypothetical protein E7602_07750 [Ruminococcaceae bacterium]|nr:hypothetical protein [Oscillospiraceae bacterium]